MSENHLLFVAFVITDPVTITDELIPSGETSSLRSNPFDRLVGDATAERPDHRPGDEGDLAVRPDPDRRG